jgi:hypothetical protein
MQLMPTLHELVIAGDIEAVKRSLADPSNSIDVADGYALIPLEWIQENSGDVEALQSLFSLLRASASERNNDDHIRSSRQQFLNLHKPNIDARDKKGFTALHYAVQSARLDLARLLLSYGADVDVKSIDEDDDEDEDDVNFVPHGPSAITIAVKQGDIAMTKFLLENYASLATPEGLLNHPIASQEPDSCDLLRLLLQVRLLPIQINCCVLCAVCCVLCAVCCVLCAVCCVLCAVCCVLCAMCCLLCAVCCLLSAVCCLLSAVCCLLSAVCCLLSAVCCVLSAVCCLLSAVCCLLSAVCCLLSAVCCLLSAVCCVLSAVCCLLCAVCCVLSAVCCLLCAVCCVLSAVCCLLSAVCRLLSVCCLLSAVCCLLSLQFTPHFHYPTTPLPHHSQLQAGYELQPRDCRYVEAAGEECNALFAAVAQRRRDAVEILLAHCADYDMTDEMVNCIDHDERTRKAETPRKWIREGEGSTRE